MQSLHDQAPRFSLQHDARKPLADELDHQLRRAEAALYRRAFGLSASVVLRAGIDEEGAGDWQLALCFGKHEGRIGLYLEAGFVGDPVSTLRSDVLGASLETRLLAAQKLPVLARALELPDAPEAEQLGSVTRELARFLDAWRQ